MNWNMIYRRIPDRVRVAIAGLALGALFVAGPRLLAAWLRLWI